MVREGGVLCRLRSTGAFRRALKDAWRLACRALKAGNRLHTYLRNCPKKKPPNQEKKNKKEGEPDDPTSRL
jgi:hypothetical protein